MGSNSGGFRVAMAMPASMGDPVAGDDSAGFDELEREFVRKHFPDFDWVRFDTPSRAGRCPFPSVSPGWGSS